MKTNLLFTKKFKTNELRLIISFNNFVIQKVI